MTRWLVVLALIIAAGASGAIACGGPDKPPLTPDTDNPQVDGVDSGRD